VGRHNGAGVCKCLSEGLLPSSRGPGKEVCRPVVTARHPYVIL